MFWVTYDPYFAQKKSNDVDMAYLAKIIANVPKSLKSFSFEADFLYDENIEHSQKKLKIATLNEADFRVKMKF